MSSTDGVHGRVRTATVLQLEATECGAASLAMVLGAHGRWVSLEELRVVCGVSRDGTKAGNILRGARTFGLEARGFRQELAALPALPVPAIVFVNLNHFLVLEGFSGDRVYLNDPAAGRRVLTTAEFDRIYSGIVLTFVPTETFQRGGARAPVMARLLHWMRGNRDAVAYIVTAGFSLALFALVIPSFTRIFIDDYLVDQQDRWIPGLLAIMLAAALVQGGLVWLRGLVRERLATRVQTQAAAGFVWRMLRLPIAFYAQRFAGSIGSRSNLTASLSRLGDSLTTVLVVEAGTALMFLVVMTLYSPALALVALLAALANLGLFLGMRGRLEELGQKAALDGVKLEGRTMLGLQMIETLKASGTDDVFFSGWAGQHALVASQQQQIGRVSAAFSALPEFMGQIGAMLVLVVGGWLVMNGQLSIGMLVAFQLLQAAFNAPVSALLQAGLQLQNARGVLDQLDDVLAQPMAPEFAAANDPAAGLGSRTPLGAVQRLSGQVNLRGLQFGYNRLEAPLIEGFDLDLVPGGRIALVGASGSGKSTVGRLVTGLFEPWGGEIRFDGRLLHELPRTLLRNSLAVVDQDIVMFEGTVRDNIALWDETMPEAAIVAAATDAAIHDVITARPGAYGSRVEEGGRNFSGGQRQRIEIARALVTNPTVLVLDEATSALDPVVEKEIMDNLRRRGCSCLIIAHRLSTVRDCDEIIVMQRGKILERGSHELLMARNGAYAGLVEF